MMSRSDEENTVYLKELSELAIFTPKHSTAQMNLIQVVKFMTDQNLNSKSFLVSQSSQGITRQEEFNLILKLKD